MGLEFSPQELVHYMGRCVGLARQAPPGIGKPLVGAIVLSSRGKVVGQGYRKFVEGTQMVLHAERMAIYDSWHEAKGGTLITTLEPCVAVKRDQVFNSCCQYIEEAGIDTVIYGVKDSSPSVNNCAGINSLIRKGIEVKQYSGLNGIIEKQLMYCSKRRYKKAS